MDYATLCTNIQSVCENQFSAAELAMFVQQAEQKIYNSVQLPALRDTTYVSIAAGEKDITTNFGFGSIGSALFIYSIRAIDSLGNATYLLNKDTTFLNEAYPNLTIQSAWGTPRFYAIASKQDATSFHIDIAPPPAVSMQLLVEYASYPDSIVDVGTTWLGEHFDSALLNGSLVEALRFMKGEQDMVAMYDKMFLESMQLLKQLGDGKLKEDTYRFGQPRVKVI